MKSSFFFIIPAFLLASCSPLDPLVNGLITSVSPEYVKTFESTVVKKIVKFFKDDPFLVDKQKLSSSPTGVTIKIKKFTYESSSFDVNPTNSTISPYTGNILLSVKSQDNSNCGDVKLTSTKMSGFSSEEDALFRKNDDSCYSEPFQRDFYIDFVYKNNKWFFKGVRTKEDGVAPIDISAGFGVPSSEASQPVSSQEGRDINKLWLNLVEEFK